MSQIRTTSMGFSGRQQRMWRRNQNTVPFASATVLGPVTHTVLIALMIAVLGLIYLTQVTKTSLYGFRCFHISSDAANMETPKAVDYATN